MPQRETLSVVWGIPGVAESAQLLPESTPELLKYSASMEIPLSAPDFTRKNLAAPKDATWILPILQVTTDFSVGVAGGLFVEFIKKFTQRPHHPPAPQSVRVLIRRVYPHGEVEDIRIEGSAEHVVSSLHELRE